MAFKFFAFCALIAVARAGVIGHAPAYVSAPIAYAAAPAHYAHGPVVAKVEHEDYDPNPQYSFAYDVQDSLTGDSKAQHESRSGDVVQGQYSLIDADGFKRTVDYTADPHHGFNAVVHREPLHAAKVVHAAPVHAAPVHAAPVHAYAHQPYYHH